MQKDMILNHLLKHGSITPLEAMERYGIMRLSAIVYRLKKDGTTIVTEMVKGKNRFGAETRFARYSLKGEAHGSNQKD